MDGVLISQRSPQSIWRVLRLGENAVGQFEQAWLGERVLALHPLERVVILWRFGIGVPALEPDEIAARLTIPVDRVVAITERALARLRGLAQAEVAA